MLYNTTKFDSFDVLDKLLCIVARQVNKVIVAARLRIWPEDEWPEYGDTELVLKFLDNDGNVTCFRFGYAEDQQSMTIRTTDDESGQPYERLSQRIKEWADPKDRINTDKREWEVFDLENNQKCNWLIKDRLIKITLIVMMNYYIVTDMILHFASGHEIWIVAGRNGCTVNFDKSELERSFAETMQIIIDNHSIPINESQYE